MAQRDGDGGGLPTAEEILSGLNPPQREAVLANDGPLLILAGAGSGKTRTITHKVAYLVAELGFAPWNILAVTFTNKAAGEMRERCAALIGEDARKLWLGTFHSIGARLLRRHAELAGLDAGFVIYDQADQKALVKRCMLELNLSEKAFPPARMQSYIERAKRNCRGPEHPDLPRGSTLNQVRAQVYARYQQRLAEASAVDFGDLLFKPLELIRSLPTLKSEYMQRWRYVLVDEFQDTNHVQYQLLKEVLNAERRICVVGDDDQSIYRWRGATVENILGFGRQFEHTTVIRLEQNYRSSKNILAVAGQVIESNRARHPKKLWTDRDEGELVQLYEARDDREEARWVHERIDRLRGRYPLRQMAVFYRTNAQSRSFEDAFRRANVPYAVIGGLRFYERAEVKDVLAYLRVIHNPADVVSLERIINNPPRGIGKGTLGLARTRAEAESTTLWQAVRELANEGRQGVRKKLAPFVALIEGLRELARMSSAFVVALRTVEQVRYLERLQKAYPMDADMRIGNVHELLSAITEYGEETDDESLAGFLDQVSLVTDLDGADMDADAVVMMTAHTAKGLEFDVVFVTGLEEGLFPHANSSDDIDSIEEERRLAYVAMTRARDLLHLTYAMRRRRFDTTRETDPSRFLDDVPESRVERHEDPLARMAESQAFGSVSSLRSRRPWKPRAAAREYDDGGSQAMPDYEDFSQDGEGFGVGSNVFHPRYGVGRITASSGVGPKAKCTVRFPDGSERRIIAKFLTPS